jgi:hypothetical protein
LINKVKRNAIKNRPENNMQWLAIALGGALGSVLRFAAVGYFTPLLNYRFPLGTFVVNIAGSFFIGVGDVKHGLKNTFAAVFYHRNFRWIYHFLSLFAGNFAVVARRACV